MDLGAYAFLEKPLDMEKLDRLLREAAVARRARQGSDEE
jgi:DNA-binding NtrC family response regulator